MITRGRRRGSTGLVLIEAAAVSLLVASCSDGSLNLPVGATEFTVPTYVWDGDAGMDAAISGVLVIDEDGCTGIDGEGPVMFPGAIGVELADGTRAVVHETTGEVFAVEGEEFPSYAGGYGAHDTYGETLCSGSTDAEVATVNDDPAYGSLNDLEGASR
jgi:hypothetical protein